MSTGRPYWYRFACFRALRRAWLELGGRVGAVCRVLEEIAPEQLRPDELSDPVSHRGPQC
jgi:hypothetical protein